MVQWYQHMFSIVVAVERSASVQDTRLTGKKKVAMIVYDSFMAIPIRRYLKEVCPFLGQYPQGSSIEC